MIAVAPSLEHGEPFPTTFWLVCPRLREAVSTMESRGEHVEWTRRAAAEPDVAALLRTVDDAYRAARMHEGGGEDPCGDVGVAGQRSPLVVKCLHSRLAAFLAGIPDPVGEALAADPRMPAGPCTDARCAPDLGTADGRPVTPSC